jgi:hypothetical protein
MIKELIQRIKKMDEDELSNYLAKFCFRLIVLNIVLAYAVDL